MIQYLRLYRIDAALITLFSGYFGLELSGSEISLMNILSCILVSAVSVNFIYSYNSWSDWKIDAVNKPHRPIPSGKISEANAYRYCMFLLLLSFAFPLLFFNNLLQLGLYYSMPVMGLLYSNTKVRLKEISVFSTLLTALILVVPMTISYFGNKSAFPDNFMFVVIIFVFCLHTIPFKDVEDVAGDTQFKSQNWMQIIGFNGIVGIFTAGSIINLLLSGYFIHDVYQRTILFSIFSVALLTVWCFKIFNGNRNFIYKTIILEVISLSVILYILKFVCFDN